jgi:GNAT superfamily N-acetyltransferase
MTDVRIRIARELSEEERQALGGGETDPFGVGSLVLSWRAKDWHLFAEIDGRPVSHVGLLAHEVEVNGLPVAVAGVGGVLTAPEHRNQGLAQRLLREVAPLMTRTLGAEFGLLFCFPRLVPFYERLGWTRLEPPVLIEQPGGEVAAPLESMALRLGSRDWPPGAVRLGGLPW